MRPLTPSWPAAVKLVLGLLALALATGVLSLVVQGRQTQDADRETAAALTGGDEMAGRQAISLHGCGACHEIPGLPQARGQVGPSLDKVAVRAFIGGGLANTPQAMTGFVARPEHVQPQGGMPDMPVTPTEARDIAAYLYTLR